MGRKKKFEEGTAEAFKKKTDINKITKEDASAIMKELDDSYVSYRERYDKAESKEEKDSIEKEYLTENAKTIDRIKYVGARYDELQPGVRSIIGDVFFNMKYTEMISKYELMSKKTRRGKR